MPGILYVADDRDVLKVMIEPIGAASQTRIDYVVDVGPTLTIERSGTVVAAAGRIGTVEVTLRPTRRGRATIERIWLGWTGPMGLMRRELIKPRFPIWNPPSPLSVARNRSTCNSPSNDGHLRADPDD